MSIISLVAAALAISWIATSLYLLVPLVTVYADRFTSSTLAETISDTDVSQLDQVPSIDVFIPAYQEGGVIDHAIGSVCDADYPSDRLNVYVLTEPDDDDTRNALDALADEYSFTEVVVPSEYPGVPNKPRALNFGFESSDGDIVGIVDAENVVAADTFANGAKAIERAGYDYVQGRVDMVNERDGWLNTLFRAEYGHWYEVIIPTYVRARYPIPLSGTTCFFSREVLEEISDERLQRYGIPWSDDEVESISSRQAEGSPSVVTEAQVYSDGAGVSSLAGKFPWNPLNVTEDFELGHFLWENDYDLALIDSTTAEESPQTVDAWLKQRTRWQKGKIQTFLTYLRNPPSTVTSKLHLLTQAALPHLGLINVFGIILLLIVANLTSWTPTPAVRLLLLLSFVFVPVVASVYVLGYLRASDRSIPRRVLGAALVFVTVPFYWLLQWMAEMRALKQMYLGELHWEKTVHRGEYDENDGHANPLIAIGARLYEIRWVFPVLALGLGLRLLGLGERSYWLDEVYSALYRGSMPVDAILVTTSEPHPPLYYVILHYWMELFGNSPAATRMLSVLLGLGTILVIFQLGREWFDHRTGVIAALLVAVSVLHIFHSQNVRMYQLLATMSLVSLLFFGRAVWTSSYSMLIWYVVSTWLMLLTHAFAGFVVLAQNLYVLGSHYTRFGSAEDTIPLSRWLFAQSVLAVLSIPIALLLRNRILGAIAGNAEKISWVEPPELIDLLMTFLIYFGHPSLYPVLGVTVTTEMVASVTLIIAILVVVVAGALHVSGHARDDSRPPHRRLPKTTYPPEREKVALLALVAGGTIVIPFFLSHIISPIYIIRNTIVASGLVYLLAARGISSLPDVQLQYLVAGLVVSGMLFGAVTYHSTGSEEKWAEATAALEAQAGDDSLVMLHPAYVNTTVEYYADTELRTVSIPEGGTFETATGLSSPAAAPNPPEEVIVLNYQGNHTSPVLDSLHRSPYRFESVTQIGAIEIYTFEYVEADAAGRTVESDRTRHSDGLSTGIERPSRLRGDRDEQRSPTRNGASGPASGPASAPSPTNQETPVEATAVQQPAKGTQSQLLPAVASPITERPSKTTETGDQPLVNHLQVNRNNASSRRSSRNPGEAGGDRGCRDTRTGSGETA